MPTVLFAMSAETACAVFEAFTMAEALSEEERINILMKFVDDGRVVSLATGVSKADVVKALVEHMRAIYIKRSH